MDAEPILGVYAQLAAVILGLSGIAGVIGGRAAGNWQLADHYRFWTMMASGFLLLFQAILPVVLLRFGIASRSVWIWSSATIAVIVLAQLYWRFGNFKEARADSKYNALGWWVGMTLQVSASTILLLNATNLGFKTGFAPYLLAMSLTLALSCLAFLRLLIVAVPRSQ